MFGPAAVASELVSAEQANADEDLEGDAIAYRHGITIEATALSLYGTPFHDLSNQQKSRVFASIDDEIDRHRKLEEQDDEESDTTGEDSGDCHTYEGGLSPCL